MQRALPLLRALVVAAAVAAPGASPPQADAVGPSAAAAARLDDGSSVLYATLEPFRGDLPEVWRRGELRVLVPYSHTEFFVSRGRPAGYVYEMMMRLQDFLNEGRPKDAARLSLVFVPTAVGRLVPDLLAGRGDVAAGLITVTPERQREVAFSTAIIAGVDEVVVRHKDAAAVAAPEDLAGKAVHVLAGSSAAEHLRALGRSLEAQGRPAVQVVEVPPPASREDLLEMVDSGMAPYTIADGFLAELWAHVLGNLRVEEGAAVARGGAIAWAVRPGNPELLTALDRFASQRSKDARVASAVIFRRYFENARALKRAVGPEQTAKLREYAALFQEAGDRYGFDWLLLGAQALQESQFDPAARNPSGALGLMQVLPRTGQQMGFPDVQPPRPNVLAGAAYLNHLRVSYFADADPAERIYFSLASYNAGPGTVRDLRARAERMGLDPRRWFGNVEVVAQHFIGDETVEYVTNISRYYLAYRLTPGVPARPAAPDARLTPP